MKLIETWIPSDYAQIQRNNEKIIKHLEYLFKNPEFVKSVEEVRRKFSLPAYGIKSFIGVTDRASRQQELANETKFHNDMAIIHSDSDLRSLRIGKKSKKNEFEKEIKRIRIRFDLPILFQGPLGLLIRYGKFSAITTFPVMVRVYDDNGEPRIFIEIFGQTQKNDLEKAWFQIKKLQEKYDFPGRHLHKYDNYYRSLLKEMKLKPVDKTGNEIADESFQLDYNKDNIDKHRLKKYKQLNYNK